MTIIYENESPYSSPSAGLIRALTSDKVEPQDPTSRDRVETAQRAYENKEVHVEGWDNICVWADWCTGAKDGKKFSLICENNSNGCGEYQPKDILNGGDNAKSN